MNQRERVLAVIAGLVLVGWFGLPFINRLLFGRMIDRQDRLAELRSVQTERTNEMTALLRQAQQVQEWSARSLPPDPIDAQRVYQEWLTELALMFDFDKLKVVPGRRVASREKIFTAVYVSLEAECELLHLLRFLDLFDRVDLAQRIDDLVVKPLGTRPTDRLQVSLNAQGLAFAAVRPRAVILPETVLAEELKSASGASQLTVKAVEGFPREAPFAARLGTELVTVTECAGPVWTVRRGVAGTPTVAHAAGTRVQLLPLQEFDAGESTIPDRLAAILASSPFAIPVPTAAEPPQRTTPLAQTSPPPSADTSARDTYLIASVEIDGRRQAWLLNRGRGERTVVTAGTRLSLAKRELVIQEVGREAILLREGANQWRLALGSNFEGLARIVVPAADPPAEADFIPAKARRPAVRTPSTSVDE